jgi:PAS domain S-box-containing protein
MAAARIRDETKRGAREFERYQASWEHSEDALLWADTETAVIVDANPRAGLLLGRSHGDLIGLHVVDLHPADQRQLVTDYFAGGVAGKTEPAEFDIQRPDGVRIPVEVRVRLYPLTNGRVMLLGTLRDITERRLAEREAASRIWALSSIHQATVAAMDADSDAELMNAICAGLTSEDGTTFIALANDDEAHSVTIASASGPGAAIVDELDVSWADEPKGNGVTGRAIRTGTTQIEHNASASAPLALWRALLERFGVESIMAVPLRDGDRVLGAIEIFSEIPDAFGTFEQGLFEDVSRQLVLGMRVRRETIAYREQIEQNRRQQEHTLLALEETVAAITTTIEYRDPYTAGHGRGVAKLAEKIGLEFGLPSDTCHGLFLAGLLHDVGKVQVPSEILSKPGRLSEIEFALLKTHPEVGYDILRGIEFPWPIAEITRQHHERIDGSGYPRHLRGADILPEAQIVACADIVDAICAHRPYRAALGIERALEELRTLRGVTLDAGVVDAALRALQPAEGAK